MRDGKPSSLSNAILRVLAGVFACAVSATPASAVTRDIVFYGSVTNNNQCVITVVNHGRFGVSGDMKTLSSKLSGGFAAVADVQSNHAYQVSAVPVPTLTIYPNGGNTGVALVSAFSGQSLFNGSTFAERAGTSPVTLRNGLSRTRLTVHLTAARASIPFPTGFYQGVVVVRCE